MEIPLCATLVAWLAADPTLSAELNSVTEEAPSRTSPPWLAIAASASTDWSTKDRTGREVRIALELHGRGDSPDSAETLAAAIEQRVQSLPRAQPGFHIVATQLLRTRVEQLGESRRAVLIEHRFRLLAH